MCVWWVMGNQAPENNGSTTEGKGNYVRAWGCRKPDLSSCEPKGAWHKFSLSSFPEEKLKGSMMGAGVERLTSVFRKSELPSAMDKRRLRWKKKLRFLGSEALATKLSTSPLARVRQESTGAAAPSPARFCHCSNMATSSTHHLLIPLF